MSLRSFIGKTRWHLLEAFSRRNIELSASGPIVSFTFDDFPRSALEVGGSILKQHGVCGTYYAAMGLMGSAKGLGEQFSAANLARLLREGHELGSHTFDHISCRFASFEAFQKSVIEGMQAVEMVNGGGLPRLFSYPYGHVTFRAKKKIGPAFSSCRGIIPGINRPPVDLNCLRANSLYSGSFDLKIIENLYRANEECKGWLIFYTHDISEKPSPFGCTPVEFEKVVNLAVQSAFAVKPVGRVVLEK